MVEAKWKDDVYDVYVGVIHQCINILVPENSFFQLPPLLTWSL